MKYPRTFDLDSKPESTTSQDVVTPDNTPDLSGMGGNPSIKDIKEEARQAATPSNVIPPGAKGQAARKQIAKERQEQEDRENAAATEAIGKVATRKLATMPYNLWAYLASDPSLRLSVEEVKELSEAYFHLIKAMKPNLNKPKWIFGSILLLNFDMVSSRLQKKLEQTEEGRRILKQFAETEPEIKQ